MAGVKVGLGAEYGWGQGYHLSVGSGAFFSGSVAAVPDDPKTPEDEYEMYGFRFAPAVYRHWYETESGEDAALYVMTYAANDKTMRLLLLSLALTTSTGYRTGLLAPVVGDHSIFWGTRGCGTFTVRHRSGQPLLEVYPPPQPRWQHLCTLRRADCDSVVYVGEALGGWSNGCPPGEEMLPNRDVTEPQIHGFLGTSDNMAWFWAGDGLVQVSGETGACKQILDKDPLTVTDLRVVAAVPYVHETPARRTVTAWVQGSSEAINRKPPFQVVVDLDLRRYVSYNEFQPSDAECVDVLGVGGSELRQEGVIVVAYNLDGERVVESRFIDATGNTIGQVPIDMGDTMYPCDDPTLLEPRVLGQLQANDAVYAGLLEGEILAFNEGGGAANDLPFSAQGVLAHDGFLWITELQTDDLRRPVQENGSVAEVIRRKSLNWPPIIFVEKLRTRQRYSPASRLRQNPHRHQRLALYFSPIDDYATDTTGWLVAGPGFESTLTRTAVAFAPVGITVP